MVSRSAFAMLAAIALLSGCVTANVASPSVAPTQVATPPPTATLAPSATPSPAATQPATAAPTATATQPATAAPTATATPVQTPSLAPTAAPSGSPGTTYNTKDQLFDDPMTDPQSGWGVATTNGGTISFQTGQLQLDPATNGAWVWSRRQTNTQSGTMAVVGELTPTSDGIFGMLCDSGDTKLMGGLVSTAGEWFFVSVDSGGVNVLSHGDPGAVSAPVGQTTLVAVECAAMTTGKMRLEMWLGGQGLVATYEQAQGPQSFDAAAVYGESSSDGFSLSLTHAQAFGVANLNGEPSAAAQDLLLNHVPHDWSSSCFESPVPSAYASWPQTIVTCFLGKAGRVGAEVAEYQQYDNADQMNADYQSRVTGFPPLDLVDSCQQGSTENSWSYNGQTSDAGRIACAPQAVGIRFDWTESQLKILSTLVDFDGNYGATWSDWLKAGPN